MTRSCAHGACAPAFLITDTRRERVAGNRRFHNVTPVIPEAAAQAVRDRPHTPRRPAARSHLCAIAAAGMTGAQPPTIPGGGRRLPSVNWVPACAGMTGWIPHPGAKRVGWIKRSDEPTPAAPATRVASSLTLDAT